MSPYDWYFLYRILSFIYEENALPGLCLDVLATGTYSPCAGQATATVIKKLCQHICDFLGASDINSIHCICLLHVLLLVFTLISK